MERKWKVQIQLEHATYSELNDNLYEKLEEKLGQLNIFRKKIRPSFRYKAIEVIISNSEVNFYTDNVDNISKQDIDFIFNTLFKKYETLIVTVSRKLVIKEDNWDIIQEIMGKMVTNNLVENSILTSVQFGYRYEKELSLCTVALNKEGYQIEIEKECLTLENLSQTAQVLNKELKSIFGKYEIFEKDVDNVSTT